MVSAVWASSHSSPDISRLVLEIPCHIGPLVFTLNPQLRGLICSFSLFAMFPLSPGIVHLFFVVLVCFAVESFWEGDEDWSAFGSDIDKTKFYSIPTFPPFQFPNSTLPLCFWLENFMHAFFFPSRARVIYGWVKHFPLPKSFGYVHTRTHTHTWYIPWASKPAGFLGCGRGFQSKPRGFCSPL